jgi:hypothetical protein
LLLVLLFVVMALILPFYRRIFGKAGSWISSC